MKTPFKWPKYISIRGLSLRLFKKTEDENRAIYFYDSGNWEITVARVFTKEKSKLVTEHKFEELTGLRVSPTTMRDWKKANWSVLA